MSSPRRGSNVNKDTKSLYSRFDLSSFSVVGLERRLIRDISWLVGIIHVPNSDNSCRDGSNAQRLFGSCIDVGASGKALSWFDIGIPESYLQSSEIRESKHSKRIETIIMDI